jgi:site-specific DNA recombinase
VVIAWALDRLTRNRRDTLRLIETCQKKGATIALVRGSDLDMSTPAGRLTADLLAAVARSEIEVKSDRQKRAAEQAVEQDRWIGGRRPFGYESDGVTVLESEAAAVRPAYSSLIDGVSLRQIAKRWNDAELWPPQGKRNGDISRWDGGTVSRCLRKPRYAGLRAHEGVIIGEAVWPPLVDIDTWHTAQAIMNNPTRRPPRGDQKLLTGVAVCGICGGPVHAGGGAPGRGVYRCAATQGHFSRKRLPVDEFVSEVMIARLSRPDAIALFSSPKESSSGPNLHRDADQEEAGRVSGGVRRRNAYRVTVAEGE